MHSDRDIGRSVRDNFGEEDKGALTQEGSPKLQRRETRDFGGGTPYSSNNRSYNNKMPWELCHLTGISQ